MTVDGNHRLVQLDESEAEWVDIFGEVVAELQRLVLPVGPAHLPLPVGIRLADGVDVSLGDMVAWDSSQPEHLRDLDVRARSRHPVKWSVMGDLDKQSRVSGSFILIDSPRASLCEEMNRD